MKKKNRIIKVAFILVALSCFIYGCNKTEDFDHFQQEAIPSEINQEFIMLDADEAKEFQNAIKKFNEQLTIKNGLIHLETKRAEDMGIPDFWYHKFREGIKYQNHLIRRGEIEAEQILKPKKEIFIIDTDSNKLKSLKDQDLDDEPKIQYTYHGNFIHEFNFSHEAVYAISMGGTTASGFIAVVSSFTGQPILAGLGWLLASSFQYMKFEYDIHSNNEGMTIVCYIFPYHSTSWGFYNDEENEEN